MKNKLLIVLTLTVLVLVAGLYLFFNKQPIDMVGTTIDPVLLPVKKALTELQQDKQLSNDKKLEKTYEILEQLPPEYKQLKRQYQIAMSQLPDIVFYGRVVDQHGQPVYGASVWYEATNAYLSEGGGRGLVYTDAAGYFDIDTVGASLVLGGVGHSTIDGINYKGHKNIAQKNFDMRFLSHKDNQGNYPNWRNYTKKENAYIIHAWRLSKYEGAKKGNLNEYFNSDGRQYTLNLQKNNYKNKVREGVNKDGQLIVSCSRKAMSFRKDYGDWSATISVIDGGIQAINDLYMNEAPALGYQSSIIIDMKQSAEDYRPNLLNQRYYFTANNGTFYGSLFVNFKPHSHPKNNECRISISYKFNATGSRNLELKRQPTSKVEPTQPNRTSYAMR